MKKLIFLFVLVFVLSACSVSKCKDDGYIILQNDSEEYMYLFHEDNTLYYSGENLGEESPLDLLDKLKELGWYLKENKTTFLECRQDMNKVEGVINELELNTILLLEFRK